MLKDNILGFRKDATLLLQKMKKQELIKLESILIR